VSQQRAHVSRGHRLIASIEPRQAKPRAVPIVRIERQSSAECLAGPGAIVQALANVGKREPRSAKARRAFERLLQQIGRGGQLAASLEFPGDSITAIRNQIAG